MKKYVFEIGEEDFNILMRLLETKCSLRFGVEEDNPYDVIKTRLLFQLQCQIKKK